MLITPLTEDSLSNLQKYKYKYTTESTIFNDIATPLLTRLIKLIPETVSPMCLTLTGFFLTLIAGVISFFDGGFDFTHELKRSTCFIIGLCQFLYYILDNLDEIQAKRINKVTAFGKLIDHSCDVFTNIITAFNLSKMFALGNDDYFSFTVFLCLYIGFYMMTFEEFKVGEMHFPEYSGADEGNLTVAGLGFLLSYTGQEWIKHIFFTNTTVTVGRLFGWFMAVFSVKYIYCCYSETYDKRSPRECGKNVFENAPFYSVILVPLYFTEYFPVFYKNYKWLIIVNSSLIFARVTIDVEVKICTMDIPRGCMMFWVSNLAFIFSFFAYFDWLRYYVLMGLMFVQIIELSLFIFMRLSEISKYVNSKKFEQQVDGTNSKKLEKEEDIANV